MDPKKVKIRVQGIVNSRLQSGIYALVLAEEGLRRVPVMIGMFEAQSIALALEKDTRPRPFTHDLFIIYTQLTDYRITEVFIHRFMDGVFSSEIILTNGERIVKIDARTSDAIAIALRADCDIFMSEDILEKCGIVPDKSFFVKNDGDTLPEELTAADLQDTAKLKERLLSLKKSELEEQMAKAVAREDYEFAQIYKNELLRRKEEKK